MSRDARRWVAALGVVCVATVVLFWPVFEGVLAGSPRYFEWDVPEQYWPDLVYLCDALHDGELPLWNPYDRAGYPYYADPQSGAYHPLNWAICAAGRSPGLGWATARVVLGFALAGGFSLLWLRRLDVPMSGAVLGAVVVEAAPFMRHNWELNLTGALAWLPLMLWAADRAMVERRLLDAVVLGGSVALCAWVGSPPALWLAATFTALYGLARLGMEAQEHGRAVFARGLAIGALGGIVTAGLIAVVLIPGLTLAEHSVQAGRGYASIADGGLELADLGALVWPRPGNHLYVGLLPLALGALALRRGGALPIFFALVAAVAVLLTLGDHGPIFGAAYEWVPGVRLFRLPHRYEAWLGPAAGGLAALGVAELRRLDVGAWRGRARAVGLGLVAAGLPLALALPAPSVGLLSMSLGGVVFALGSGGSALRSVAFGGALALLSLADVATTLPASRHMRADLPPGSAAAAARVLPLAPDTDVRFRYLDEFGIGCRSGTRLRRRDLRGYQDPLLLSAYERVIGSLRETPRLAAQYNVRYALQGPHFIHGWNRHYLPPPSELRRLPEAVGHERGVTELANALPFAYWVPAGSVEWVRDRSAALTRVEALAPAPIAVLEGEPRLDGDDPVRGEPAPPPRVIPGLGVELARDRLGFDIHAPAAGVVVINEAFYPGWRATVDGTPAAITRANALVRAVRVSAGSHRIELRFEPADGAPLRWLLLATLLLCLLAWLASFFVWFRHGRHRDAADEPCAEARGS